MAELNDKYGNLEDVELFSGIDEKTHAVTGWVVSGNKFVISLDDVGSELVLTDKAVDNILVALVTSPERKVLV